MIHAANVKLVFGAHFSCFGEFDLQDRICKCHCALRIRCAVEKDQITRMELLDDVVSPEMMHAITQ